MNKDVTKTIGSARTLMMAGALACVSGMPGWGQPTPPPAQGDLLCKSEAEINPNEGFSTRPDKDGFYSMFDGTFKGWFQDCATGHSSDKVKGGIFRIGRSGGRPAIYTDERGNSGGILMSKRKFGNYEIRFQTWPSFGNEAGVFNRSTIKGVCFRTTLGYIQGSSMGGVWGEGGFTSRDNRPFAMLSSENLISIPGNNMGELSNWTTITKKLKATTEPNLPCPASGCTQADWNALWDKDGWNDIRVQFYGGLGAGRGKIHMKSWFKRPDAKVWVPIIQDTTLEKVVPEGRIGLQVHGGGRFSGTKGTWYRDIRWRSLTDAGQPASAAKSASEAEATAMAVADPANALAAITADASRISGAMDEDYSATLEDSKGRILEGFSGKAGKVDHAFSTEVRGLLILQFHTAKGVRSYRVVRPI